MKRLLLAVLVLTAACKKAEESSTINLARETVGSGIVMIDYSSPSAEFGCLAPAKWGITEHKLSSTGDETVFEGENASILISKNANSAKKTAEAFANSFWLLEKDGKELPIAKSVVNGRDVFTLERTLPVYKLHSHKVAYTAKEKFAIIQCGKDYYQIGLSAKPEAFDAALPVFESVVRSFKPRS